MTDHEALLRAVCASPDDDLPRLILADYLEEQGDAAQAEFIRTQVTLAATPPWEPFAVRMKHRRPELLTGEPWKDTLPRFGNGIVAEWNKDGPFHRGFGYSLHVKQLTTFLEMAPTLLEVCPVQELILPSGTRDDWHNLMNAPWLANIRSVKFTFASNLIEPIRALAASDYATNIESVSFDVCTSPAMGVIVEALVQSPLAKNLKRLSFSVGNDTDGEIAEQLASVELPKLEALAFKTMSLGPTTWPQLETLKYTSRLQKLTLENQQFRPEHAEDFYRCLGLLRCQEINVLSCSCVEHFDEGDIVYYHTLNHDFSSCIIHNARSCRIDNCGIDLERIDALENWKYLRQFRAYACDLHWRDLLKMLNVMNWISIVEMDLSGNKIPDHVVSALLDMPIQEELTAFVIDGNQITNYGRSELMNQFGDRLVLK